MLSFAPDDTFYRTEAVCFDLRECEPYKLRSLRKPRLIGHFYRNSISATLSALPRTDDKASTMTSNSEKGGGGSGIEECSIGSAGSLAKRNQHNTEALPWDDEDVESGESLR